MERFLKLVLFGFLIMSSELPNYFEVRIAMGCSSHVIEDDLEKAVLEAIDNPKLHEKLKAFIYVGEGETVRIGDKTYKCEPPETDLNVYPPIRTLFLRDIHNPQ